MLQASLLPGVSVILCCFNSRERILPTLVCLADQKVDAGLYWEIILVDNASTDNTAALAKDIWLVLLEKSQVPFRIVEESRPGQTYARIRGLSVVSREYVLFCDDDNWLNNNYVQGMYNLLSSDPSIGAVGGTGVPEFEKKKPYWFDSYAEAYAVGAQELAGTGKNLISLYGAGLAVRGEALRTLYANGFSHLLGGRAGSSLSSSDDTELTNALVLHGYTLSYAAELKFRHYLPQSRLTKEYLNRLFKAFGKDGPVRNLYFMEITNKFPHVLMCYWPMHLAISLGRLIKYLILPPKKGGRWIYLNWNLGYLKQLIYLRKSYSTLLDQIGNIKQTRREPSNHPVSPTLAI